MTKEIKDKINNLEFKKSALKMMLNSTYGLDEKKTISEMQEIMDSISSINQEIHKLKNLSN